MSEILTYAKAGVTPDNWHGIVVLDRDAGDHVTDVVEANVAEGWLIRYARGADGQFILEGDKVKTERLTGRFALIPRRASAG